MTIRFSIPGIEDPALLSAPAQTELFEDAGFKVRVEAAVRVEDTRAAALAVIEAEEDDVVELTFDDGVVFCVPAGALRDDILPAGPARGAVVAGVQPLLLPPRFGFGAQTRGLGDWLLRKVRRFVVEGVADVAAAALVARIEGKLDKVGPGAGLYRCPSPDRLGPAMKGQLPSDGASLVFIHGTASHTGGSFGGLVEGGNAPTWAEIQRHYPERVFALEHRTLSQSPAENALEIARRLPKDARLHLVTHSRGGLVGELLCRSGWPGGFDDTDLRQFEGDEWEEERGRLQELGRLLTNKGVRVERFVRVACPARGTTLASRRLDRYLSLILNCIGLIPALAGNPLYGWVKSLLVAVAKKRADPKDLPGLQAQMPESPLIKVLNRQDAKFRVDADLTVIAGDIEGSGVWKRLGVLATDLFYREDHDLVVNTSAMTGGGRRTANRAALYAFDAGSEVSHFNYFRNTRTVGKLAAALRSEEERRREFLPIPDKPQRLVVRAPRAAIVKGPKPVLFLLPGIMGSQLASGNDRIWVDLDDIAEGKLDRLAAHRQVRIDGMMDDYDAITHYLGVSHEVVPFPYDWRLSVFKAAKLLNEAVEEKLETSDQPIRFLAHSLGGLVVRAMIAAHGSTWKKVEARPGTRFVMLGTPNNGSYVVLHIFLGREPIFRKLAGLDLTRNAASLADLIGKYPGLYDLLPVDSQASVFDVKWWEPLAAAVGQGWPQPAADLLKAGAENRGRLDREGQPDPRHTIYVAGVAEETPWGVGLVGERLELRGTARGDGRVTWASGIPAGVPTWYMEAVHGKLATHPPAFLALQELLANGTTDRLSRQAPVVRAGETDFPLRDRGVDMFPDAEDLEASALGYTPSRRDLPPEAAELEVSVTLGHLEHARFPVMVGHYLGDGLYSAEAALDARLDRRLSRRYALGAYPGELDTAMVVLDAETRPRGAVIVGLGEIGELSPGKLARTITRAVLRYAADVFERKGWPLPVGISAVPVGSGESGVSLEESITAILRGVAAANRRLAESSELRGAVIRHVELVELVEDVAVCAARAIGGLAHDAEKPTRQPVPGALVRKIDAIRRVPGARRRIPCGPDQSWWQRLRIDEKKSGTLTFVSTTERARAPETAQPTQPALGQRLVDRAVATTSWDPRGAHTLFSLLVPNALKIYTPGERNVVLQLNEASARYPWELLADDASPQSRPFAVRAGVLRQLRTTRYRPRPIAAAGKTALVIGDPAGRLAELRGAQAEAQEVAQRLRGDFEPTHLHRPSPDAVLDALFAEPYRIIHFAGHGDWTAATEKDPRPLAGMVLDDGLMLTSREVRNLVTLPDLVVVNCCHLGAMGTDELRRMRPPEFAASLAAELIEMGVRAVVAAGWAVDDAAARTFALELYDRLLRGETFGYAVKSARRTTYEAHGDTNTWGAYQCYGDPGFHLRAGGRLRAAKPKLVDPCELLIEIENLLAGGREVTPARLKGVLDGVDEAWLRRADVNAAVARARLATGEFQESAERCLEALQADSGALPFDVLEVLLDAVEAGAVVDGAAGIGTLLPELAWLETRALAPSRRVRLAGYRAGAAIGLSGAGLDDELERIEKLLQWFVDHPPTAAGAAKDAATKTPTAAEAEGLLALAEVRVLRRELAKKLDPPAKVRALLARVREALAAIAWTDPARIASLAARLAILESMVGGDAIELDDRAIAQCTDPAAIRTLIRSLRLARHVLESPRPRAGITKARLSRRERWANQLRALEARIARTPPR